MKLSKAEASTLLVSFTDAISNCTVSSYGAFSIQREWAEEALRSLADASASKLTQLLDDSGLVGFVRSNLKMMFLENGEDFPDEREDQDGQLVGTKVQLTSYLSFSDPMSIARRLVGILQDAPFQYRIVTRAPMALSRLFGESSVNLKVSDQLRLLTGDNIPGNFQLKHNNVRVDKMLKGGVSEHTLNQHFGINRLYFEYRCSGIVSDFTNSRIGQDFSDTLRAFYGVCFASRILFDWGFGGEEKEVTFSVNRVDGEDSIIVQYSLLDSDLRQCTMLETTLDTDNSTKNGGRGLEETLSPVIAMFAAKDAKLYTASIWMLRASLSNRPMDKILESTIAIEVLLGDREAADRVGLSKLMANRCAYSLGKSATERVELTKFFSEFYKVRSDIVHGGRFKLSQAEQGVVSKGLKLASRILAHEIVLSSQ